MEEWLLHCVCTCWNRVLTSTLGHKKNSSKCNFLRVFGPPTHAPYHYIKWAKIFDIPDPCGYYKNFIGIMAIYIKYVQCGINYNNKQVLWSATVRGYAEAVNNLFKLRTFSPPADLSNSNNMTAILFNNML
jgi:hypothetical protein